MSETSSSSPLVRVESNTTGSTSKISLIGWLARVTMGSISLFVLLVVLLHFLRPETNPLTRGVSYYAVGPYGFLMTAAFLILSLGGATLTFGLLLGSTQGHRSPVGLLLLGIWSLSVALAAIFPIDAPGAPPTAHGMIHGLVGTSFLLFIIAVFLSAVKTVCTRLTLACVLTPCYRDRLPRPGGWHCTFSDEWDISVGPGRTCTTNVLVY